MNIYMQIQLMKNRGTEFKRDQRVYEVWMKER